MAKILNMRRARKPVETKQRIRAAMAQKQPTDEETADWSTTALVVSSSLLLVVIVLYIVRFHL